MGVERATSCNRRALPLGDRFVSLDPYQVDVVVLVQPREKVCILHIKDYHLSDCPLRNWRSIVIAYPHCCWVLITRELICCQVGGGAIALTGALHDSTFAAKECLGFSESGLHIVLHALDWV